MSVLMITHATIPLVIINAVVIMVPSGSYQCSCGGFIFDDMDEYHDPVFGKTAQCSYTPGSYECTCEKA